MKWKHDIVNQVDVATAGLKEILIALNVYITNEESPHISDLSLYLKKLEKKPMKPKQAKEWKNEKQKSMKLQRGKK